MLQICNVKKEYKTGDLVQTALNDVSLNLRDNEFVAILGPSGSGKTTLLNIIGGLDRYDSGDLIINGISTRKYTDRDWDSYRNHSVGFVFQNYNLIPHQTVLSNVELALTISGISRSERRHRARKALEDVGLGDQLHKRPNQMSGGQMQRVAIARALVNNPDILLADEPTGALDSETSVQVMDLLKEVSKDRLVVMVTHNPELAEEYANRIVRLKDGKIRSDSNPLTVDTDRQKAPKHKNMGKASMSFLTALSLSFNNLRTKLGRTLLTSFAGSIGIIGIALILSLSTGFQNYIDKIQADTLNSYPLMIQSETADMAAMFSAYGDTIQQAAEAEDGTLVEQQMISQMFAKVGTNDLGAFKRHMEDNFSLVEDDITNIKYSYGISPLIYCANPEGEYIQANPGILFAGLMGNSMMASYMDSNIFYEMINDIEMLDTQYEVVRGKWPEAADELIFVLSDPHQLTDYAAYTLGMRNSEDLMDMIKMVMDGKEVEYEAAPMTWTYDDLMNLDLRLVPMSSRYQYNAEYKVWEDMSEDEAFVNSVIDQGTPLKIVGIVIPKEGSNASMLSPGIAYTNALTHQVIDEAKDTPIVKAQLRDLTIDVFTGKEFIDKTKNEESINFEDMLNVDGDKIASAFDMNVDTDSIIGLFENYVKQVLGTLNVDTAPAKNDFDNLLQNLASNMLTDFVTVNADADGEAVLYLTDAEALVNAHLSSVDGVVQIQALEKKYDLPEGAVTQVVRPLMIGLVANYIASEMELPDMPDLPEIPNVPTEPDETLPEESIPDTSSPEQTDPEAGSPEATEVMESTESAMLNAEEVALMNVDPLPTAEVTTPSDNDDTVQTDPTEPSDPAAPSDPTDPVLPDLDDIPQIDSNNLSAVISLDKIPGAVSDFMQMPLVSGASGAMATRMMLPSVRTNLVNKLSGFGSMLMGYFGSAFHVDEEMLESAFEFNMDEEQILRLMNLMSGTQQERTATSNLRNLGYADPDEPIMISIYFKDFAAKEHFLEFLDGYNDDMEATEQEDQVISYTDLTGIMISSMRTIIDSVSYVLIAFVAVSLVVSSIMIGIITYISVMERTKEIGVLRAIGASKRNISQVFNAETFIIGLCAGAIGIGVSFAAIYPINYIIHHVTENPNINAQLPVVGAIALVILSVLLTIIGGLIPSRHAAKKDPVIALRTE